MSIVSLTQLFEACISPASCVLGLVDWHHWHVQTTLFTTPLEMDGSKFLVINRVSPVWCISCNVLTYSSSILLMIYLLSASMGTFNQAFLTLVRASALLASKVTRLILTCWSNSCITSSRTPSHLFISAPFLVYILLSFIITDSTHAYTVTESVFISMFLSSNLMPFINSNSATFMWLASVFFLNQAASSALIFNAMLLASHQTMSSSTFGTCHFPLTGFSLFASSMISFITLSVLSLARSSHFIFSACLFT